MYRHALAMQALLGAEKDKMRERHKRIRKSIEAKGVILKDIDEAYRMKDMSDDEVIMWFKRKAASLGALFTGIVEQFDIFAPKANPTDRKLAFRHIGLMAGLDGKPATAPPNLAGADLNDWLEGHAEGAESREAANADFLAAAMENAEKGIVTDGTVKGAKAKAKTVGAQAAADFKADNPGVKLPGEATTQPKGAQTAETPDPDEVAKAARALKDKGFAAKPAALSGEKAAVNLAK